MLILLFSKRRELRMKVKREAGYWYVQDIPSQQVSKMQQDLIGGFQERDFVRI